MYNPSIKYIISKMECSEFEAKNALNLCNDPFLACEFLRLKANPSGRIKKCRGMELPWSDMDYLVQASANFAAK